MNDDLTIPDFLDRRKNGYVEDRKASQLRYMDKASGIVWPPKRDISYYRDKENERRVETDPNDLTPCERDEVEEIKAMVKTSAEHAKRMATDFVNRTPNRKAQARRRQALRSVKGLK